MPDTAGGRAAAYNATARTGAEMPSETVQRQREQYAAEAEAAVKAIQAKLDGMKESLVTAKAEAKRLRAEAEGNR
jgi:hypothetical protein